MTDKIRLRLPQFKTFEVAKRVMDLHEGLKLLRADYPPALEWTGQMLDTLNFVIFGERPSQNDWIEMALSQERKGAKTR